MKEIKINGRIRVYSWSELDTGARYLLESAARVRQNAATAVSEFMVGAAVMPVNSPLVFVGCNVEDIAYNSTIHAESSALGAMIATLGPEARIRELAIVLGPRSQGQIIVPPATIGEVIVNVNQITYTPCGHCRGLLGQYGGGGIRCLCLQKNGQVAVGMLADFLPCGFSL